jgi:hypothetical protein
VHCKNFILHQNSGKDLAFVLHLSFPNEFSMEQDEEAFELNFVSQAGGVSPILGPMPGDGVLNALLQLHVLNSYPKEHKLLYVES